VLAEKLRQPRGGLLLLEAELGIAVDLEAQRLQLAAEPVHRLRDLALRGVQRRVRAGHG
jgi:hypothetical protein